MKSISEFINPVQVLNIIKKDPDDNKFLECAAEFEADFIITGDKHILELGSYQNIKILSPSNFIKKYY